MAAPEPLPRRAQERARVDAAMLVEAPVLVGDQHRDIARIDVVRRRRQPPAPVGQGEGAQQPAVAVDDDGRAFARGHEIERPEARFVARPGESRGDARDGDESADCGERDEERAARRAASLALTPALSRIARRETGVRRMRERRRPSPA